MLPDSSARTDEVTAWLVDAQRLRAGRVHPVNVLIAQRTYAGMPISAREASAALALVQLATEQSATAVGSMTGRSTNSLHDSVLRPCRSRHASGSTTH